ncbi:reverse transcriptase domain-containing protein [Tanacetum coccineum]|uniref:Reverse transcriptase domain-containing protein n=1 Tax=Tanacetum coccineum TaxID=301880 RepID=A0ABQ5EQA0_9ASTR
MDLKTQLETVAKNHQASIQNLETKFDRLADKQSGRPSGSLPSNTQPNPKGHNSKAYQPPQSRNEHMNAIFTRSGKSYNPPDNPNDQQNDSRNPINFDSDEEDDEPTPQPQTQNSKSVKETLLPKPYKPKIPYPERLRKEKMEARYGKFLDMIRTVRINVPLIDVLARMPNYGKFLKELISNKHKIKQISAAFLSDESSSMIQNKVPPKLEDLRSFCIPCNFNKTFSCNALADLGASINLMPYSLYAKLLLETLKPTKMSVRLADRSFQYPVGIAENMLVKVVIRVKQKQLNIGFGTERMIFNIDSAKKYSYSNVDTCFSIDFIHEILEEDFDALLDKGECLSGMFNAPATISKCMLAISSKDMIKESVEVFMDDFSIFGNSFNTCLNNLDKMLQHCKDAHLVLNWEKCHFMVKEGIVLGHKVSSAGLEVDKAKINVISKLQPTTNIKGVRSFLGHAGFYRHFIKDFSKIARPITKLLKKDTPFEYNDECQKAFESLK